MSLWDTRPDPTPRIALCVVLALLSSLVYAGTVSNGFIGFDDPEYVSKNPIVRQGLTWHGIGWALRSTEQANWHPLTWLSHMLDVSLFGVLPGPHHLVSALLHSLSAVLLYLSLESLTGARWSSALVAAIFAAHPLHVESVAWIAERKDVLCGFFWMLGLWAYSRYVRRPSRAGYLALTACFGFALLSKPMAVTFPLVLLVLDWWPLQRIRRTDALALLSEKLPLLAASLIAGIISLSLHWQGGAIRPINFPLRLGNVLVSTAVYPLQILWPRGLGVLYPFPEGGIPWWRWFVAALFLVGLTAAAFLWRRRHPWLAAGWIWYLITLAPVSGLIPVGAQAHADRYTYVPTIGLTLLLAWGVAAATRHSPPLRALAGAGAVAAVLVLAGLARAQVGRWHDSETLFRHTLLVAGESSLMRAHLGGALGERGRWEEALREYEIALRMSPDDSVSWFNTGTAYAELRRWAEAEAAFRKVIDLRPDDHQARFNLGMIAASLGDRETAEAQRAALTAIDSGDAKRLAEFMALRGW